MTNILDDTLLAEAFPGFAFTKPETFSLSGPLKNISILDGRGLVNKSPFQNAGLIIGRKIITCHYKVNHTGPGTVLADVLEPETNVPESFFVPNEQFDKWRRKRNREPEDLSNIETENRPIQIWRKKPFPDSITKPSRTITTQEGSRWPSWNTHVILTQDGRHRRLLPVELERLNLFPDNYTADVSDVMRGFLMGNALVVGLVEKIGVQLAKEHFSQDGEIQSKSKIE